MSERKYKPLHLQFFIIYMVFSVAMFLMNLIHYLIDGKYYPASMIVVCILVGIGIAHYFFKGTEPGPEVPERYRGKYYMKMAPLRSKLMWILFGAIGALLGFYFFLMDAVSSH